MNKNLPPIQVFVDNKFLLETPTEEFSYAHLISIRAMQNQCLQFTVLLESGALYTGLPPHAIFFEEKFTERTLQEVIMWDNISNNIDVVTFDTLLYMPCEVLLINNQITSGSYLFTIDYVGKDDLSRSAEHWKQLHVIRGNDGRMYIYPQYRIKFLDRGLCLKGTRTLGLPKYKHNTNNYIVGS